MATELYSVSADFTSGFAQGQFHNEILAESAITTTLVGVDRTGDAVSVIFVSALSAPEKTALDNVVANHVPNPALEPRDAFVHYSGDQMIGDLIMSGASILPFTSGNNNVGSESYPFAQVNTHSAMVNNLDIFPHLVNQEATGFLTGGEISVNPDPTKFDILSGTGHIVDNYTDPENPTHIEVNWPTYSGLTPSGLGVQGATQIGIDSNGNVVQTLAGFTLDELRDVIKVGGVVHPGAVIISASRIPFIGYNDPANLLDFMDSIGPVNREGNVFTANGTNLFIDKSAGSTFRFGVNYENSVKTPNTTTDTATISGTFFRTYRDGSGGFNSVSSNAIDPDNYDNGTGTLASVPANDYTIQRIFYFAGSEVVQIYYGQNTYANLADAESQIFSESFESADVSTALLRAWLIVREGTTDLTNTSLAKFITAGKFGSSAAGSATSATTTLQQAYDNSIEPEIVTDATRDGFTVKEGAGVGLNLYEGKDSSDALGFYVSASGNLYSNTIESPVISGATISGSSVTIDSLNGVLKATSGLVSGSSDTDDLPEGSTNLYYTAARVSGVIATQAGQPNGLATLNASGVIPNAQVPPLAITETFVVASSGAQVALPAQIGDVAVRTDESKSYILRVSGASDFANWQELLSPTDSVISVNGKVGVVVLNTDDIAEGVTNLYYTDARVDANSTVVGNTADIATVSGIAVQNQTDIITVSGLTVTNANNIAQNTTDIATVSGIAVQNQTDIATVSGIASTAIQSGVSVGNGEDIFSAKNGTDLEFRTVSGVGNISLTVEGDTVVFSGTGDGNGDVVGPASSTDNAVALYDGTTGKLIKDSSITIVGDVISSTNNNIEIGSSATNNAFLDVDLINGEFTLSTSGNTADIYAQTNLITITAPTIREMGNVEVSGNVIPWISGSFNLGTPSLAWDTIYVDNIVSVGLDTDLANISGLTVQNATDIATVSGIAIQNQTDIANVSGTAFSAIQSGISLGTGSDIFSAKNGTNLEFNTIEGKGDVVITTEGNNVVVSGISSGSGEAIEFDVNQASHGFSVLDAIYHSGTSFVKAKSDIVESLGLWIVGAVADTSNFTAVQAGKVTATSHGLTPNEYYFVSDSVAGALTSTSPDTFSNPLVFVEDANTVHVLPFRPSASGAQVGTINNGANLGNGVGTFNSVNGDTMQFNSISGLGNVVVTLEGNEIHVSGTSGGGGEANTASNVGAGLGVFKQKTGVDLEFYTLSGLGIVDVSLNGNVIEVSGTGDGNGDVVGPASATDNAVALYDGTTGKLIKDSSVIVTGGDTLNASVVSGTTISGATINADLVNASVVSGTTISGATINSDIINANEISGVNARGFAFAYDTTTQTVAVGNTFQDITFDTNAELDGWTHTPTSGNFVCGVAGTYKLDYSVTTNRNGNPSPTIEFRNRKNGVEISGSQTSINVVSTNVHQVIGTSSIFTADIGDTITLQMTANNTNGEIDPIGTNAGATPSARMTIYKL